jgi:hypothetical protein
MPVLLATSWLAADVLADPATPVSGRIRNRTGLCGEDHGLSVQLLGADMSPRFDLPAGGEVAMAVPRGLYGVTALGPDGRVVEESRVLVTAPGFLLSFGCPRNPGTTDVTAAPPPVLVPVELFNSSMDCGRPETVSFFADGLPLGRVEPGARVPATAPQGARGIEVFADGRRTVSWTHSGVIAGTVLTYGCTVPEHQGPAEGIPVAFENTTDSCTDPLQRRYLTLWLDGAPAVGLAPGQLGGVRVTPGPHEFQVFVGQTQERVIRGTRDVSAPFRIHFGCGR